MTPHEAFKHAIETWEGGYQDDPADLGNIRLNGRVVGTMRGVTPEAWAIFKGIPVISVTPEMMKAITLDEAASLSYANYYDRPGFDRLKWCQPTEVWVDVGWGSGPQTSIKHMQRMIGAHSDGIIGRETMGMYDQWLESKPVETLVDLIADWRCAFYKHLVEVRPQNQKFLKGWLNRANWYRPSNKKWWWM